MSYHQDVLDGAARIFTPDEFERLMDYGQTLTVAVDYQRIIENTPQPQSPLPWHGRVEPDDQARRWHGETCERVEQYMDQALGPLPKGERYLVIEGGHDA
jgi:hypothetical protein